MSRKQKWEKEFEEYDEQNSAKIINELSTKFNEKSITKDEYTQLNKMISIYKNVKKVANIVELKNQLEEKRDKINKEIENIKKEQELEEKIKKEIVPEEQLEEELNKIQEELSDVSKKLNSKDLSEDEKDKLEKQKIELLNKKEENNKKFVENRKNISKIEQKKDVKDIKKLEEEKNDLGIKISKCCFAGKMLMAGKNWDYIEIQYEKNKKYNSKDRKLAEKVSQQEKKEEQEKQDNIKIEKQEKDETDKTIAEIGNEIGKDVEKISQERYSSIENNEEIKALTKQSKFKEKHPRLAKIFDSIKNLFNRKNNEKDNKQDETIIEETPKVELKKEETPNIEIQKDENSKAKVQREVIKIEEQKSKKTDRDEFLDYLKVVSEKGMNQAKKDTTKQKFEENKKAAYARETEKFGEKYAKMSYKEKQTEEKQVEGRDWRANKSKSNGGLSTNVKNKQTQLVNDTYLNSLEENLKKAVEEIEKNKKEKTIPQNTQMVNSEYMCLMQEDLTKAIEETIKKQHEKRKKEESEIGE